MKKLILLCYLLTINIILGQNESKQNDLSKAELFSSKSGTLIKKVSIDIGKVEGIELKIIQFTDMISGESLSALRFEKRTINKYSSGTKVASLDIDELDGLIKSIIIIRDNVFGSVPKNYTEINFKSRSGFQAGCFFSRNEWGTFLQIKKHDNKSFVLLKRDDFYKLLELLEIAKKQLT
ncbi:hypothetical protein GWK08_13895 [Leptobacterium flavescens]|uniref:Uncharacterized protein n=1 Tax=Leptobacterium flavescens TaxID=472055 RepID=A0A6P0UPV7_9FLAO|nr:hypothetical protein [Leptobacterium flavescens]NER14542.1 hypothetical protein [Leptobacterium flavescens]